MEKKRKEKKCLKTRLPSLPSLPLLKAGCGARPTDGQAARDNKQEEGAWAPSEEWWGYQQEIAMCHEVIDELMSSR